MKARIIISSPSWTTIAAPVRIVPDGIISDKAESPTRRSRQLRPGHQLARISHRRFDEVIGWVIFEALAGFGQAALCIREAREGSLAGGESRQA